MAISRPPAKPWGDPAEAVRCLVRQLAAAGEPGEGVGAEAGVLAGGCAVTAAVAVCVDWAARLGPEHAQVVTHSAARTAIRSSFIIADPFRSNGTA